MIRYSLVCKDGHEFEGWFQNSAAFDSQASRGLVECPHCGVAAVSKAMMAPAVTTRAEAAPAPAAAPQEAERAQQMYALMRKLRDAVEAKAEYVGPRFAEEARKIHYEETPERGIYGEASTDEVKALADEGIPVLPLPRMRGDLN
jgi:hypothetical protein